MIWRALLLLPVLSVAASAQAEAPVFYSWHTLEYQAFNRDGRDVALQLQFRTREHFSSFNLLRGAIAGSQKLAHGWVATAGYFHQNQESANDDEWSAQQRVFSSISRPWVTRRLRHFPRFQYDYLFGMPVPAYGRYRFAWQTEFTARIRPYAGAEEFIEHAGVQRLRPRAGIRFRTGAHMETDLGYIYDRIYLRSAVNRHIFQTTITFHPARKD